MRRSVFFAISSILFSAGLSGCGEEDAPPRPQWTVLIETDALIPQMGDRLLLEILTEEGELACSSCRREAVVATPEDWPASFGITKSAQDVYVRTRLYRGDRVGSSGQPNPETTIDHLGRLPPLGEGTSEVLIALRTECIGSPVDLDLGTTCLEQDRRREPPQLLISPGESSDRLVVNAPRLFDQVRGARCSEVSLATTPEMACIDGGMFFLGNARAPVPHSDVRATPSPERLVGVASFLLDKYEVSVAEIHAYLLAHPTPPGGESGVYPWQPSANSVLYYCTYLLAPPDPNQPPPPFPPVTPDQSLLPINCVSRSLAATFCANAGKRLPTEAEWEYAASRGATDTRFVWGNEPPTCTSANLARYEGLTVGANENGECVNEPQTNIGVDQVGIYDHTGSEDTSGVFDLAGNLAEWTSDVFEPYGEANRCWGNAAEGMLFPAQCGPLPTAGTIVSYSVRGGSWMEPLEGAWSANRSQAPEYFSDQNPPPISDPVLRHPGIGFRCAKDL